MILSKGINYPPMKKILILSLLLNLLFGIAGYIALQKLGGINYVLFKLKNKGVSGVYEHRKTIFESLPMKKNGIVFLGDSITEACEWTELFKNNEAYNRGIAGDMTDGVLRRLDPILEAEPRKIFLMIGVNDLIRHSVEDITDNYGLILKRIKKESPSTKVYVQSVLPVNNQVRQTSVFNKDIIQLNDGIEEWAHQIDFPYLNLYDLFLDENGNLDAKYTQDGIHLNGKAYLVWKNAIAEYID